MILDPDHPEVTLEDVLRDVRDFSVDGPCLVARVYVDDEGTMVTPVWEPHGQHTEPEHCREFLAAKAMFERD